MAPVEGHGPGLSLAWDRRGKPVAGQDDPDQVFHKLFSPDDLPLEQRQAAIAENRSVLDTVRSQARHVQRGLTKTDTDKLDEYFQGIRDIETRLKKEEAWLDVPKAKAPLDEPQPGLKGKAEIEIMQDLIVAALQTDSTRTLSYRMPGQSLLQSLDLKPSAHNVSHYSPGERMDPRLATRLTGIARAADRQTEGYARGRRIEPFRSHRRGIRIEHQLHSLFDQLPNRSHRRRSESKTRPSPCSGKRHPAMQRMANHAAGSWH